MRKYYHLFTLCAAVVIAVSLLSGFSDPKQEQAIEKTLSQRTNIMQKAFYKQMNHEKAEQELEKIETYPLLTEDIRQIRAFAATELDVVKNMSVTQIQPEKIC